MSASADVSRVARALSSGSLQPARAVTSDDEYYRVIVAATGKCLGVSGESQDLRAQIRQCTCDSGWKQQWDLRPTDNDYYEIVARHSNKCMGVQGDYVGPGGQHLAVRLRSRPQPPVQVRSSGPH
jgi:hypothetical protein